MNELKKENTEIKLKYSEEKFKLLFELSPVGMAIIDQETGKFLEVNNYLLQLTSYTKEEFLNLSFWDITPKKYEDQERQQLKDLNEKGQFGPNEKEYIRKDKSLFPIEISGLSFVDTDGRKIVWGLITDITEKKNNEIFAIDNKQILEYIATENSLENIFDKIVTLAQIRLPESKCSILLLDESKKHLFIGSAPDLPTFYNQAINGIEIGPEIGSCGSAVYYSKRVIVEDINNHENWKNYSNLTLKANLHSCWSEPIFSTSHEVLGTFGIYYCYPKKPSNFELKLIETYANLISKAIEKDIYTKNIKESKYQLEQLFNNAQSGLLYINEDRIVIRANQRFVNILGYDSPEEIIGLSVESFHLDKKQYEYFGKNNFDTLVEKEQFNLEYKLRKKDGSLIWCELAGKALDSNIPADLSKGVLWTIHDISLKKKYEVELKQREILLKNIISTIPDMLWLKDKEGTYLMCNEEFEKFFGAKEADIIGKTDYDFVDKKLADFFRHNDKVAMESKKVSKNDEWVNYASNNKRVLLETSKKSLKNQNDEIIGILGLGHDITKRKEREDELKKVNSLAHSLSKSQQVLLSLFDKGDSVLFKWNNDLTWSVDYASLSVLNFFGYTREQFLSEELSYSQCIHPEDLEKVINEVRYSIENNLDYFKHAPYRIITKDGQIKWVLDYTVTEKENNKIINFIGYITDITEQIKNQEILIQQSKLTSMGQMIGNIAHQWRQPLSAISTQATGMKLKKEFNDLSDEEFYSMCESINSQAQYLSRTIDDFKNFIKGDRTFQLLNVQKVIDKLLILLAGSIKNHHIKIISNIDNSIEFYGYENELIQCFINIFNNSKDALDEINANEKLFFLSTKLDKNNIELHFKDNAGGIDKEILPNIFNPYFTTKHESQGTGLGLFMTYNLIVEGMNGFIEAKNCEYTYNEISYKGVEMIISLPLHRE